MSISDDRIKKAGAYVLYQGRYAFMVGFGGDTGPSVLNVVRFGGHREPGESPVQCALRELKEESSLDLRLCDAPCTYLARSGESTPEKVCFSGRPRPILAREGADRSVSVMYLAHGSGVLAPAMETQGILLLAREDLRALCSGTLTLGSCLERGAVALLAKPLPNSAPLRAAFQARFLNDLFEREPEFMERFESNAPAGDSPAGIPVKRK